VKHVLFLIINILIAQVFLLGIYSSAWAGEPDERWTLSFLAGFLLHGSFIVLKLIKSDQREVIRTLMEENRKLKKLIKKLKDQQKK